jgi:hypothetical protein
MVASAGTAKWSGGVAAGAQRSPHWLGRVGGPFGDRGDRPGTGQDRGGGQGQVGDQRVVAVTGSSGVGDGGEAASRCGASWSGGGSAWVRWARAAGIGDDGSAGTASVWVMRLWKPHDRGRSRLRCTIRHHVTNETDSQNDGAAADRPQNSKPEGGLNHV